MPELIHRCMASHEIPGYEHRFIGMEDCLKGLSEKGEKYVKQALSCNLKSKWTKISDYLRLHYLLTEGGIYVDADCEVLPGRDFDKFLGYRMFCGRETKGWSSTHLIGAEAGYPFLKSWIAKVEDEFRGDDDHVFEDSIELLTNGYWPCGATWEVNEITGKPSAKIRPGLGWFTEGFMLFPSEYFNPFRPYDEKTPTIGRQVITPNTVTVHHNMNSWQAGGNLS